MSSRRLCKDHIANPSAVNTESCYFAGGIPVKNRRSQLTDHEFVRTQGLERFRRIPSVAQTQMAALYGEPIGRRELCAEVLPSVSVELRLAKVNLSDFHTLEEHLVAAFDRHAGCAVRSLEAHGRAHRKYELIVPYSFE